MKKRQLDLQNVTFGELTNTQKQRLTTAYPRIEFVDSDCVRDAIMRNQNLRGSDAALQLSEVLKDILESDTPMEILLNLSTTPAEEAPVVTLQDLLVEEISNLHFRAVKRLHYEEDKEAILQEVVLSLKKLLLLDVSFDKIVRQVQNTFVEEARVEAKRATDFLLKIR